MANWHYLYESAAPPGYRFGGSISVVGLVGGPGEEPPPHGLEKFLKISKKILKKIAKMDYCRRVSKKVINPALTSPLWTKNTMVWDILRKFARNFNRNLQQMHYFALFSK